MKKFSYIIQNPIGIHARPAGMIAKEGKQFESKILVTKGEKSAAISKIMALMALGIQCGDEIEITVEGADEELAFEHMKRFLEEQML